MTVTDSYKKLLKRWPGESTEGLIGRYRLKLVSTCIMMKMVELTQLITFTRYPRAFVGNG